MSLQLALEKKSTGIERSDEITEDLKNYNEALYERFVRWMDHSGKSVKQAATKLCRNPAMIKQYLDLKYKGQLSTLERDIEHLLHREEDLEFTTRPDVSCDTSVSKSICEMLGLCDRYHVMGIGIASAGAGKTEAAKQHKRKNPTTILVTMDLTRRSLGSVLTIIAQKVNSRTYGSSLNSERLDAIIEGLQHSNRLLVIDEAHLLGWDAFETIRTIYDRAKIGICYLGMPKLFKQMRNSRKAYSWDQISSRVEIQRFFNTVNFGDVKLISDSICPHLPKNCLNFLYQKAREPGRFRNVVKLLTWAVRAHEIEKVPINLKLLKEVDSLLTI